MQKVKKEPKIAFITEMSPKDKHAWSGTAHYAFQSLSNAVTQVTAIGPARPGLVRWLMMFANQISLRFFKKRIDYSMLNLLAKFSRKKYENKSMTLLLFAVGPSTVPI